ncbi:hypothetical protein FRB99_001031 [Tulasnella sp. 403]|nr:hypothetical protein FRB99_001031 [Tulasnella sp. 403]
MKTRSRLSSGDAMDTDATITKRGLAGDYLMRIPTDVFALICDYLHPLDLRNLSLTARGVRRILMCRSQSRYLWHVALSRIQDLPECPSDISEPHYVRLMLTTECFNCLGGRATKENFFERIRLCRGCWSEKMLDIDRVEEIDPVALQLTHFVRGWPFGIDQAEYYAPSVEAILEEFRALPPDDGDGPNARKRREFGERWSERADMKRNTSVELLRWKLVKFCPTE